MISRRQNRNFRINARIYATTLTGQKIIGHYRGSASSFGVWVFGSTLGQPSPPEMHRCSRLSITLVPKLENSPKSSPKKLTLGQTCQGLTSDNRLINGKFMQVSGPKFAHIKSTNGICERVLRDSLLTL